MFQVAAFFKWTPYIYIPLVNKINNLSILCLKNMFSFKDIDNSY